MKQLTSDHYFYVTGIRTKEEFNALLDFAIALKVPVYGETRRCGWDEGYHNLCWSRTQIVGNCGMSVEDAKNCITVLEFIEACRNYNTTLPIKLTDDYTATFDIPGIVRVGCQRIPYQAIKDVYKTIIKLEEEQQIKK